MDSRNNILSLLGLSLRGGHLVMGEEPVEGVARARDARLLLLASDASDNTRRRVAHFADAGQCIWIRVPFTKEDLGRALGRSAVAVAAITDIGLAATIAHRLADLEPERFAETAQRLDVKAQRAAERKAEQRAHERNIRTGKFKAKKVPVEKIPAETEPEKPASRLTQKKTDSRKPKSRPSKENRPKPRAKTNPYAHSRPVKKGKGSFRKKEG